MNNLLDKIDSPEDLKKLSIPELANLCREMREFLINSLSRTGGHLAPSLGVVELTLVLHYVFDSPRDKIVWDVGHQAYVHKILTGRRDQFHTIRQFKGISGFPNIFESEYDCFGTGHASTAISAALGMATARDLQLLNNHVVAVVGDGALTGGLALEGLNNAGASGRNLIVILNDNKMSISKNVGALSKYLTTIITAQSYNKLKNEIWEITGRLASFGEKLRSAVGRLDESLKSILVPGLLFERLGFRYFGPVDGHNISRLMHVLRAAKRLKGPILIHVMTTKGKGYQLAEENAPKFHGLGAFDKTTGESVKKSALPSYSKVFGETLVDLAQKNDKLVAITAAMSLGTGLVPFAEKHPDRFFDVGIAEGHGVTFAAGLATQGLRPVVAIYSTFLQRGFDSIIHDVALQKLPVIFALDRAGLVGDDGPTHHGVFDLSYLRVIPNMVVMSPKDEAELKNMLYTATKYTKGPIAVRYPRGVGIGVSLDSPYHELPIGKAETLKKGSDALIAAIGPMVYHALEASKKLANKGISVEVINARFVKPLDEALFKKKFKHFEHIFTLEDNTVVGGFGSALEELLLSTESYHNVTIHRLGVPDHFVEHGTQNELYQICGMDVDSIAEVIVSKISGHHRRKMNLRRLFSANGSREGA
ncbi:MAG: 1-deoxy-D-xylulose-5-phosphate synthase [Calditrichaeota bacterium]|nr:1-deoxy-D-xylulose-5-phosphate synthase [Calditrichota bacterium]